MDIPYQGNNPCRHCTKETGRKPGCQSVCPKYLAWYEERQEKLRSMKRQKIDSYRVYERHRQQNLYK